MCPPALPGYTVNVSQIAPLAQNLTQAGAALLDEEGNPNLLIRPVVQVRCLADAQALQGSKHAVLVNAITATDWWL